MNKPDHYALMERSFKVRLELMQAKQNEYTLNDDAVDNFIRNGKELRLHPLVVWEVYFAKHWDSVRSYIIQRTGDPIDPPRTESMWSRIDDMQNYLDLLRTLLVDLGEKSGGLDR